MVIPPYPAILTEADWKKRQGTKAKLTGSDALLKQLGLVAVCHKGVLWQRFDLTKALPQEQPTPRQAQAALDGAQAEYERSIKVLLGQLTMLQDLLKKLQAKAKSDHLTQMAAAAAQLATQAAAMEAVLPAFEAARDKAKSAAAQARSRAPWDDEPDEPDSGDPEKSKPRPVRDVISPKFFADLEQVRLHRDDDVRQWVDNADLALAAPADKPSSELADIQRHGKQYLLNFVQALAQLRALRDQSLPPRLALRQTREAWVALRAAFDRPGFLIGAHRQWSRRHLELAGGTGKFQEWERRHAAAADLHRRVSQTLETDLGQLNNLEQLLARVRLK